jgi:hypothetical protein
MEGNAIGSVYEVYIGLTAWLEATQVILSLTVSVVITKSYELGGVSNVACIPSNRSSNKIHNIYRMDPAA